jgi:hypothetical protein
MVMAVDSMLRGANRAQVGIQRLHDQALVGAERSRVGIWLGLRVYSKPDANMGTRSGESSEGTGPRFRQVACGLKINEKSPCNAKTYMFRYIHDINNVECPE